MTSSSSAQRPPADFHLYSYLHSHGPKATVVLGGSATPSLSLDEIISLSSQPEETKAAFTSTFTSLPLGLATDRGLHELRAAIASTYHHSAKITPDKVVVANGTSGSNHIVYRSLLCSSDHVIIQYPIYGPCIEEPRDIGCQISRLHLDASENWDLSLSKLKSLIVPGRTKMLIFNSPVNPTGTHFNSETQRSIIEIAKEHNLIIHCDEIFRPLFHATSSSAQIPTSFAEHQDLDYTRVITTSSLSKCYGLSGVRVGWITTRDRELYDKFLNYRMYSIHALSLLDEAIATEVLGPRCRQAILDKHLRLAKRNLDLIQALVDRYPNRCEWVRPTAGAVSFVKFKDSKTGKAVDDVAFCAKLVESKGVVLAPASLCFAFDEVAASSPNSELGGIGGAKGGGKGLEEFKGRVRIHFTCETETLEKGLKLLEEFLDEETSKA